MARSVTLNGAEPSVKANDATLVQRRPPSASESSSVLDVDDAPSSNLLKLHPELLGGPKPKDAIGPYQIVREVGAGGMGVVYEAVDQRLRRRAALKMIRGGGGGVSADAVRRFQTEAEAVAQTQHPNIVQIYDAGWHEGQPYVAFEYLPGGSLYAKSNNTPQQPIQAAALVKTLAEAMHHAHSQGIIHRDLKPANILFTVDGVPKVTDFGAARLMQEGPDSTTPGPALTRVGEVIGTPQYMAPEQARGQAGSIAPAIDIYALGAVLYHLLTGRAPHDGADPFEVLNSVVKNEPLPPRRLVPRLPRDLETICLKALEKHPSNRYESAKAMADDLGRFLAGESILAKPDASLVRLWKKARRKPVISGLVAGLVIVAAAGLTGVIWQWRNALAARDASARDAKHASESEAKANTALEEAKAAGEIAKREAANARDKSRKTARLLYRSQVSEIALMLESGDYEMARKMLISSRETESEFGSEKHWEWHFLDRLGANYLWRDELVESESGINQDLLWVHNMALSPDGSTLAVSAGNPYLNSHFDLFVPATLFLVDTRTGATKAVWRDYTQQHAEDLLWVSQDLIAVSTPGNGIRVFRVADGNMIYGVGRTNDPPVQRSRIAADGQRAAIVTGESTVAIINLAEQRLEREITADEPIRGLMMTRQESGSFAITLNLVTGSRIFDGMTAGRLLRVDGVHILHAAIDATRQLAAVETITIKNHHPVGLNVWNLEDNKLLWKLPQKDFLNTCGIMFSPDSEHVAGVFGSRQALSIYHARTGQLGCELRGHTNQIFDFRFSPDGRYIATASNDATARLWDIRNGEEFTKLRAHTTGVRGVCFDPNGWRLYTGGMDGTAFAWDLTRERVDGTRLPPVPGFEINHDGAYTGGLWCGADGYARLLDTRVASLLVFDPATYTPVRRIAIEGMERRGQKNAVDFALSADCTILAGPNREGDSRPCVPCIWDARTGKLLHQFPQIPGRITAAAANRDGSRIAFSSYLHHPDQSSELHFYLINSLTGQILLHEKTDGFGYPALTFDPSGEKLYMGLYSRKNEDKGLIVLDLKTLTKTAMSFNRRTFIRNITFSADGRWLAAIDYFNDDDGQKIWLRDLRTGQTELIHTNSGPVTGLAFSPDNNRLAVARFDDTLMLLDTLTGTEALFKPVHTQRIGDYAFPARVAFTPDGRSLMMNHSDAKLSIWRTNDWNASPDQALAERRREAEAAAEAYHARGLRDFAHDPYSIGFQFHFCRLKKLRQSSASEAR